MAVTVTNANPSTTVKRMFMGSYGPLTNGVSVDPGADFVQKHRLRVTKLTLSGTYATNGFAITPSAYGLKNIYGILTINDGNSGGAAVLHLSTTGGSPIIKLVTDNVPTELANATSVTNHAYTVILVGD